MPRKLTAFAIPFAVLLTGLASAPAVGPADIHQKYDIAPGQQTLLVPNNTGAALADVEIAFSGNPKALRIRRVRANCAGPDVTFADATPHDATVYFAGASFSTAANYFEITVENVDDKPVSLQFKMSFERGTSPPCGL
jgi:hypothetical protein